MSANLRQYVRSLYALDAVVRRVPDDAWDSSSPCDEWTPRQVLGHTMWGIQSLTASVRGEGPIAEKAEADVAGDRPVESWNATMTDMLAALDEQGALQRQVPTPFGERTVDETLGFFFGDPVMHCWDIATGAGIEHGLADELVEANMAVLHAAGDGLRAPGLLAAEREAPSNADLAGRMAALAGRSVD